jgi:LssY C-terminus
MLRAVHRRWGLLIVVASAAIGLYAFLAYVALPLAWRHYEHQKVLSGMTMITRTSDGIPGDPVNVGLVGSEEEILCAMNAAGWSPADPITLRSSIKILGSVLLDRPYRDAPVSHLFYQDKREDLAFEKPAGKSADRRHHVRFWKVLERGQEGRAIWLGAVTFDRGVGLSRDDMRVTHHIAADIDSERDLFTADLNTARMVDTIYEVTGTGPTINGRNGEGDRYYTDGEVKLSVLVEGCRRRSGTVAELANPPLIEVKNLAWNVIAQILAASTSNAQR